MNSKSHKYRYCKWWRIEAREAGTLTWQSWVLEPGEYDDMLRVFTQYVRDRGDQYHLRLLLVGPPEYKHVTREVRAYHSAKES